MIHAIHIVSVIVLLGSIVSLRFVVIPTARSLGGDIEPQLLGAAMIRVRRIAWLCLLVAYVTGILLLPIGEVTSNPWLLAKTILSAAFLAGALILIVSPKRRIWLRTIEHRQVLLNVLLALGLAIILVSEFIAYQSQRV